MSKNKEITVAANDEAALSPFMNIDPEFLNLAQEAAKEQGLDEVSGSGYYYISLDKDGTFHRGDVEIQSPFYVGVLDYGVGRRYFKNKYKKGEVETPDCWTTSLLKATNHADLVPNPNAKSPMDKNCSTCQCGAFGGDCKPEFRLAVFPIVVEGNGKDLKVVEYRTKEISIARLSPTSLKSWTSYVKSFVKNVEISPGKKQDLPTYFFVVEVTSEDTGDGYFLWKFKPIVPIDMNVQKELRLKKIDAEDAVTQGYGLRESSNSSNDIDDSDVSDDIKSKV